MGKHIDDETAARNLNESEWLAFLRRETAMEIGKWFEGRGKLHQPIKVLTLQELEAIAAAVEAKWLQLNALRIAHAKPLAKNYEWILGG